MWEVGKNKYFGYLHLPQFDSFNIIDRISLCCDQWWQLHLIHYLTHHRERFLPSMSKVKYEKSTATKAFISSSKTEEIFCELQKWWTLEDKFIRIPPVCYNVITNWSKTFYSSSGILSWAHRLSAKFLR